MSLPQRPNAVTEPGRPQLTDEQLNLVQVC